MSACISSIFSISSDSVLGLCQHAAIFGQLNIENVESGYRMGQIAMKLAERFNSPEMVPKSYFFHYGFWYVWGQLYGLTTFFCQCLILFIFPTHLNITEFIFGLVPNIVSQSSPAAKCWGRLSRVSSLLWVCFWFSSRVWTHFWLNIIQFYFSWNFNRRVFACFL